MCLMRRFARIRCACPIPRPQQVQIHRMDTGPLGFSAGTVEYRVLHPNHCGLEVSATGALGPGADPTAGPCTGSPQFRTGVGYGGHPAGGAAAGYPRELLTLTFLKR